MVRLPYFDSNGMKKGAWSEEEDNKLKAYVMRYGHETTWRLLTKYAGLARSGKSCRLRWANYLKPGLKRGKFTEHEEDLIIKFHAQLGNKWSAIATKLPGRTDNEIKNYWNAHIKKRGKQIPAIEKVISFTSEASSKDEMMKEEKVTSAFTSTLCKTTQNGSTSLDANSLIKLQQPTLSFDFNSSFLSVTQPDQVEVQPDIFLADLPPLLEEEFFYPQLHYSELSSGDYSYNMSALDSIANDDHSIIASEYVAQPVQGSYVTESFALSTRNFENGSSYNPPPQEVGFVYDPFFGSSYNMRSLDWIANDDNSIIASEYVAQPAERSYLTESFALSTWNSQNGSSYNPPPQEVGGLHDPFFESSYNVSALDWIANDDHSIITSECVAQPAERSCLTESFALSIWNSQNGSSYNPPPQEVGSLYDPFFDYFDYAMNLFS